MLGMRAFLRAVRAINIQVIRISLRFLRNRIQVPVELTRGCRPEMKQRLEIPSVASRADRIRTCDLLVPKKGASPRKLRKSLQNKWKPPHTLYHRSHRAQGLSPILVPRLVPSGPQDHIPEPHAGSVWVPDRRSRPFGL